MTSSPLDRAREAFREAANFRQSLPVLGGVAMLVLDEPDSLDGHVSLAMSATGQVPDVDRDAEFLAAAAVGVTDEHGEDFTGEAGETLGVIEFAAAVSGQPVPDMKQAIYTLFSSGEPPRVHKAALAEVAFIHRTKVAVGYGKAAEVPEV